MKNIWALSMASQIVKLLGLMEENEITIRSRQQSRQPVCYRDEMTAASVTIKWSEANYYQLFHEEYNDDDEGDGVCEEEMASVGAGLGRGVRHTRKFCATKYKNKAVDDEHKRMAEIKVWNLLKVY